MAQKCLSGRESGVTHNSYRIPSDQPLHRHRYWYGMRRAVCHATSSTNPSASQSQIRWSDSWSWMPRTRRELGMVGSAIHSLTI